MELLIVVTISVMILALLLPAVQATRELARRTHCGHNMRQIGIAYQHFLTHQQKPGLAAHGWIRTLKAYAEENHQTWICPSSNPAPVAAEAEGSLHIRNRGFTEYGGSHDIAFDKAGVRCREWSGVPLPGAGSYGLEFEDDTDWDFNDLQVRIEPQSDGSFLVTAIAKSANFTFDLKDASGIVVEADFAPPKQAVLPGGGRSSYAINARSHLLFNGDSGKILCVEYRGRVVADVVGPAAKDFWPERVEARHFGVANVLHVDGHVGIRAADDIDPRIPTLHERFWRPSRDLQSRF